MKLALWEEQFTLFKAKQKGKKKVLPALANLEDGSKPLGWIDKFSKDNRPRTTEELQRIKVGEQLTQEQEEQLRILVKKYEMVFAFQEEDLGKLDEKIQPPYKIRTVPQQPWAEYSSRKPIKVRDEEPNSLKKS
jgi:hypothetical protein